MRDIRFRVWYKPKGKMYSGSLESMNFETKVLGVYTVKNGYQQLRMSDFEIMQFTGLYDKNNNPIFEGDIVTNKTKSFSGNGFRGKNLVMIVEWDENECFYRLSVYDGEYWGFKKLTKSSASDIEVIGNIYANSELIKID